MDSISATGNGGAIRLQWTRWPMNTGTPLYVYSRARLEENYRRVQHAFKALNARIHFSVKSNSNGAILRVLRDFGAGFDVVSAGEAYRALRARTVIPPQSSLPGVGKTESELIFALENNLGWINVESVQELELLNRLASEHHAKPRVALRINPQVEADTHHHMATGGHRSKFGLDVADARSVLRQASQYLNLDLAGLHIHISSQLANTVETVAALQSVLNRQRCIPFAASTSAAASRYPIAPPMNCPIQQCLPKRCSKCCRSAFRLHCELLRPCPSPRLGGRQALRSPSNRAARSSPMRVCSSPPCSTSSCARIAALWFATPAWRS